MRNSRSLSRSDHLRHDRLLVTRFAMGDSFPTEQAEARQLLESCSECAALAADVKLIAASMQRLPQPRRPRDFRLTPEQAQRAHGSAVERFFRALGGTGWATLRPVAGVALSIGFVLAVVGATIPSYLTPAAAPGNGSQVSTQSSAHEGFATQAPQPAVNATPRSGPAEMPTPVGPLASPMSPAATDVGMSVDLPSPARPPDRAPGSAGAAQGSGSGELSPVSAAAETQNPTTKSYDNAYVAPSPGTASDRTEDAVGSAPSAIAGGTLLIYAGIAIAALSLGLLTLVWIARRRFVDPLLR